MHINFGKNHVKEIHQYVCNGLANLDEIDFSYNTNE